jgi:heterotetrameric sarcosine oxidase delta subunit
MSFLIPCPTCGPRSVYEFRFGGEEGIDPKAAAPGCLALYEKKNVAGVQKEWWYHRDGCREWLMAVRNTVTNQVLSAADSHK